MENQIVDDIGYLLHHLALTLDRQSDIYLQGHLDVGFSQFKILMALKNHPGIQQKDIAKRLGQTEASVSRQIKMLQEVGYISFEHGQQDRRKHITKLTPKGEKLIDKCLSALNRYHQPVFDQLSPGESQQLYDSLKQLHDRACRQDRQGGCS